MSKTNRHICLTVFANSTSFPPWNHLRRPVSPSSYIREHLCSIRRLILPFTLERFIGPELTIVTTVYFQCWSNMRSPARQVNMCPIKLVLKECSVQLHNEFEFSFEVRHSTTYCWMEMQCFAFPTSSKESPKQYQSSKRQGMTGQFRKAHRMFSSMQIKANGMETKYTSNQAFWKASRRR